MSSNTYENPDFTTVQYDGRVREADGERVEEGDAVTFTGGQAISVQRGGTKTDNNLPATKKTPFRPAPVILGFLCLLLLVGISVLFKLYIAAVLKDKQPITKFEEPKRNSSDELSNSYCQFGKENQTEGQTARWQRVQCHCYYTSTEKKNWTESKKDCERRGGNLLLIKSKLKQELISKLIKRGDDEDSWIGLETVQTKAWGTEWQWVDGSEVQYRRWKVGVNVKAEENSKAYTDPHGNWNYSTNGSKHWICERKLY